MQLPMFDPISIELYDGTQVLVDPIDADLSATKWYNSSHGYAQDNKMQRMHRIIASRMTGRSLYRNEDVDHANGIRHDNRRSNLRVCTRSQNMHNAKLHRDSESGYKGVGYCASREPKPWRSRISVSGSERHLGYFSTKEEAYSAYCAAAKETFGEFARLE